MTMPSAKPLILPALLALCLGGCASKEFVQQEVGGVGKRIDELRAILDRANQRIDTNTRWLVENDGRIGKAEAAQATISGRLDETHAGLAKAGAKIDSLSSGLAATNQRIDGLDGRLAGALTEIDGTQKALAGNTAQITRLEGEIAAAKTAAPVVTALAPVAAPAPAVAPAAAPATDSRASLDAIAARIDVASRRINENTSAIHATSERIKKVEASLATAQGGTQAGEAALAGANQRIAETQAGLAATGKRLDNLETALAVAINQIENSTRQIAESTNQIKALDERVARNEKDIGQASATARDALARASAAGKLAEGKLVYETQLSDETAPFALHSTVLTEEARQTLAALAGKLKAANQNVYLEIQGHTDDSGSAEANRRLALARAEAVRDYLHADCGLPLHRLSVISYGEARPLADNKTREGRNRNRRVQLVVLK